MSFRDLTIDGGYTDDSAFIKSELGHRGLEIESAGTAILTNCTIKSNKCAFGAGILNKGTLVLDCCSLTNNHTVSTAEHSGGGGGGAIETQGALYVNNTVIANNSCTEIGGGINVYGSKAYLMNCNVTGNATKSSNGFDGGGIGINGGSLYAVNSIITGNTCADTSNNSSSIGFRNVSSAEPKPFKLWHCTYDGIRGNSYGWTPDSSYFVNCNSIGTTTYFDPTPDAVRMSFDLKDAGGNNVNTTLISGVATANMEKKVTKYRDGASRAGVVIGAIGPGGLCSHNYSAASFSFAPDGKTATATFTCASCGGSEDITATVSSAVGAAASCTAMGTTTYTASATSSTNVTKTATKDVADIVALGHSYGEPDWTWTDTTAAKAKFTCSRCSHVVEKDAMISSKVTTPATFTTKGTTTYTATATNPAGTTVTATKDVQDIPMLAPPVYIPEPDPTPSVTPSSPTGIDDFGTISGVSDRMEYKLEGANTWTDVPAGVTQLTGLPAGTYLIRYKGYSAYTKVVVAAAPAYSVEVKPAVGGTATADKTTAMKGEAITFSATADKGFNLRGWMIGGEFIEADSITMPASDITVEPVFTPVQKLFTAKAKASTDRATLSWKQVEGAVKYRVYLAKADGKLKRVTTIEVPAAEEGEVIDEAAIQAACAYTAKKLKAGIIYKLRVIAVAEDGSKISSSPIAYVTPKGKSYANASKLSVSKKSVSLGAGEKTKVSAKVTRLDSKGKKLLKVSGVKKIRYMSSEPTIVKVTKYGNITALRAGTAYVYAIAADGVYKRIKVTVE